MQRWEYDVQVTIATRFCINLRTLPKTHPLAALKNKASKRFISPMQKIVSAVGSVHTDRMEVIHEYVLTLWTSRIPVVGEDDLAKAVKAPNDVEGIIIATSSSQKGGIVGMGGVVCDATRNSAGEVVASYSVTLGPRDEQNPYTAELAAIAMALECTPPRLPFTGLDKELVGFAKGSKLLLYMGFGGVQLTCLSSSLIMHVNNNQ